MPRRPEVRLRDGAPRPRPAPRSRRAPKPRGAHHARLRTPPGHGVPGRGPLGGRAAAGGARVPRRRARRDR
jgi:hypothetical protein